MNNEPGSAIQTKRIVDSVPIPGPYLLISSAMHLPRALKVFTRNGIAARPYPCDFVSKRSGNNFFEDIVLPSSSALQLWDNYIKELVGTVTYKITGKG